MEKKMERKIIFNAVRFASTPPDTRHEVARKAAIYADKYGVNVASAPYLHDIFCEALDQIKFLED
jgi:hypothetical protein